MTQRRPTSFDIAALAGVSQPTVSRALSGNPAVSAETRARVLAAAEQLHYKVDKNASGLRRQQSRTLALLFFEDPTPDETLINPFYLSMLGSMVRACASHGYDLLISFQQLSDDWHVDYEDSRKADGIILLGYGDYLQYRPRLEQLVRRGAHFVCWGNPRAGEFGAIVGSDNEAGGHEATRHLLGLGRRRIGFVGTVSEAYPEFLDRYRGYVRAHDDASMSVFDGLRVEAGPSEAEGRAAVAELERRRADYDALFAASDLAAIGAMKALQERGRRVPQDVAVVGFDDLAAAGYATPPLTTVAQDARLAGTALVEALIDRIEGRESESKLLPVTLKVRGSSLV
ncbi:LacI family DNA-binding transcriptional regulator [Sphingomonas sp. LHG3406-1]|uniref:LacI family DNA-binding transcriptional regulator n=1 Tax=Sphingomonas sp. LHG3406-1 TaxID=2804617 RepID=UPI00263195BB|nr:substrate-binding domain-containing protein [Sphingomonas sp. LHG3406-1]